MRIFVCFIVPFLFSNLIYSQSFETEYNLASKLVEKKEFNLALEKYKWCIEQNPKHSESLLGAGICLFNLKKFSTSIVYLNQSLLVDSNNNMAFIYRGMSHFNAQNFAFAKGDYLTSLRKSTSLEEKKQIYSLLIQLYIETKDYQNAITNCNYYLKISNNNIPIIKNRASIYLEMDSFDAALKDYDLCQKLNPKDVSIHILIGHIHFNKNDFKKAIEHYNISMFEDSLEIISKKNRAEAYTALEDYQSALSDYFFLIKNDNTSASYYHFEIGFCYLMLQENESAVRYFNLAFELNYEDFSELLLFRAIAYNNMKKNELACYDIKKSIELGNPKAIPYKEKFCIE